MRLFYLLLFSIFFSGLKSQGLELPRKSPLASVSYTIGLSKIEIKYSSPAVNGRKIWDDLVPYHEVWRAGANEATTISFSTPVFIEGKRLEAGEYAFFLIPTEDEWTVIFNNQAKQWGAYDYDESLDALRVIVKPTFANNIEERLNYTIVDQHFDRGYIRLGWEKLRLFVRIQVDVLEGTLANIQSALRYAPEEEKWLIYAQSAEFFLNLDQQLNEALNMIDKSVELNPHSWNYWIQAQILGAKGQYQQALQAVELSEAMSLNNEKDDYYLENKDLIEATAAKWKDKMEKNKGG